MFGRNDVDAVNLSIPSIGSARQSDRNWLEENELDYTITRYNALKVYMTRFRWEGKAVAHLPPGYIEKMLFQYGRMVYYRDEDLGNVFLPAAPQGLNYFFEPAAFTIIANGFSRTLSTAECCELRDNPTGAAPYIEMDRMSQIIADARRSLQNQITALKKTNVFLCMDEKQKQGAQEIFARWLDNSPSLVISAKMLGLDKFDENTIQQVFQPLNKQSNDGSLQATLMAAKTLFNEMVAAQGINTNMLAKSQYRSEMEIEGDTSHVELILRQADYCRQNFCDNVREKFGADIRCVNVYKEAGNEANEREVGNEEPNGGHEPSEPDSEEASATSDN